MPEYMKSTATAAWKWLSPKRRNIRLETANNDNLMNNYYGKIS